MGVLPGVITNLSQRPQKFITLATFDVVLLPVAALMSSSFQAASRGAALMAAQRTPDRWSTDAQARPSPRGRLSIATPQGTDAADAVTPQETPHSSEATTRARKFSLVKEGFRKVTAITDALLSWQTVKMPFGEIKMSRLMSKREALKTLLCLLTRATGSQGLRSPLIESRGVRQGRLRDSL